MLMNRKKLGTYAIIMAAVFLVIILVYPMMFNSNEAAAPANEPQPVLAPGVHQ
jgi:uncharacterized protein YpmB